MWLVTAISMCGTVLNCQKKRVCFVVWIFANIAWFIYDIQSALYSRALLDVVQTGFCFYGLSKWGE